ncbi:23S rRNA (guanine(745)-N(1))-methyltransferase [Shewanella sp. NIFS-20-20]|uniref:23S rRNA (guanine(745)-N(1))-methyltransferase n=1 Tax=Shewanella sp. NIFS-20-20 TaxID=2853806 RepID=UPI001C43757F|nr:23S rRNA (guanine(745)-N(1))-methyltransferase [Shewanella sp. NIFS-20-20]MBV7314370.1 23S rRNA (guanine(745)-N(1))-methyltransferase [Shewanella sp. NIFS-20-20]
MSYRCPICTEKLTIQQQHDAPRSWSCCLGHSFDIAKEGYVNLLPVNKKKSKDPGDNKEMMFARREFLNAGYYQCLSDRVNQVMIAHLHDDAESLLDIGCGEGYYTGRLAHALASAGFNIELAGLDISRSALRYAAKRYSAIHFAVASSYDMPYETASMDAMLRIYAPSQLSELQRVLKPDGLLLTVSPGEHHHFAIKKMIYANPRLHCETVPELAGFTLLHSERVQTHLQLERADMIAHFLQMTPYAWKLSDEQKQQMEQSGLSCELDFQLALYRRD